jgi:pimeloyl-ACP methyl ester carboxylesterase
MNNQSAIRNPQSAIGTSAIPLVFIHGAGSNSDFWYWQRPAFPQAHYLDLPGHGRNPQSAGSSASLNTGNSQLGAYADWVERYIETAGLSEVVMNGHSMGGAITLMLALRRPAWLRALVLTGTGARLRVSPVLLELLRTDYQAAVDAIVKASFAPTNEPLTYAQKVRRNGTRRQLLRTPQQVTLSDYEACNQFDIKERVSEINLPTLCIVGGQDAMTPVKYSEYLHRAILGSRLEIIEGAGHMLPLEKSDEYNRTVAEFLGSLAESKKEQDKQNGHSREDI